MISQEMPSTAARRLGAIAMVFLVVLASCAESVTALDGEALGGDSNLDGGAWLDRPPSDLGADAEDRWFGEGA